jgi:hypothetical protein
MGDIIGDATSPTSGGTKMDAGGCNGCGGGSSGGGACSDDGCAVAPYIEGDTEERGGACAGDDRRGPREEALEDSLERDRALPSAATCCDTGGEGEGEDEDEGTANRYGACCGTIHACCPASLGMAYGTLPGSTAVAAPTAAATTDAACELVVDPLRGGADVLPPCGKRRGEEDADDTGEELALSQNGDNAHDDEEAGEEANEECD